MYLREMSNLINHFEKLPGVGKRTATRYAFKLLNTTVEERNEIVNSLLDISKIKRCKVCGGLTKDDVCEICKDNTRDNTIIVVSSDAEQEAIECNNVYHGKYHILNGLLSSQKGVFPEDINIESLLKRADKADEIIFALDKNFEGDLTAAYIEKKLEGKTKVTRLAIGMPFNSNVSYLDDQTFKNALNNRKGESLND